MAEEIDSLLKNETGNLVELPARAKVLPNRWVYRYKPAACGREARHKARLVVKGFSQRLGIDYEETFSLVVKFGSIRSILATAAVSRMQICQFDVKTAFLHGELTEEIFMDQPKGFEDGTGRVCNLKRALYGLKQAARCWNKKFVECLTEFNLKATSADPCVFTSHNDGETLILAIYIDDGLVASTSETKISDLLQHLAVALEITAAPLGLFLGMEVEHYADVLIFPHQVSYAQKVLNRFNMNHANTVAIPADQHTDLSLLDQEDGNEVVNVPYKEAVGSLLYLALVTRPDIAYSVHAVSKYAESPKKIHWNAIKRILKYIKGTIKHGILFSSRGKDLDLSAYSDADFAGDKNTRKSTSGYLIKVANGPVAWGVVKQRSVSLSTTESEFIAACLTTKELIWIKRLMGDLVKRQRNIPTLYIDNQSAIKLIKNSQFNRRSKHIDVQYHFIRQHHEEKDFVLKYISTGEQQADIFTKPLNKSIFEKIRNKINVLCERDAAGMTTKKWEC